MLRNCFVSVVAHLFPFFLRFTVVVSTVGSAEAEAEGKGPELRDGGRERWSKKRMPSGLEMWEEARF